jgi:hypothetical protein
VKKDLTLSIVVRIKRDSTGNALTSTNLKKATLISAQMRFIIQSERLLIARILKISD